MIRLLTALTLSLFVVAAAAAQPASSIVERVQERHAALTSLSATFVQVMDSDLFDRPETVSGRVVLAGDAYRIEAGSDVFVSDGQTTWVYRASERQVLVDDFVEDEATLSLNQLLFHFTDRFRVQGQRRVDDGTSRTWVVDLLPRDEADYFQMLRLTVLDRDASVSRIEVEDANGVSIDIRLREVRENPDLAPGVFRFEAPTGVEVVDLRS